MNWLGIDLGTGSLKAAVVDDDGNVVARATRSYQVASPRPGWAETNPADWLAAARSAAQEVLLTCGGAVDGVGFSGQMHGLVLCDAAGHPLRPAILWADSRSSKQASRMAAEFEPPNLARLGSAAVAGFAATTAAWVSEHEPEILAQATSALQPKDWLRQTLGGQQATDPSDASGTLMCEVATGRWSESAIAWTGLDFGTLPAIRGSAANAGTVRLADGDYPTVVGGADTACALAGIGLRPGDAFIAVGTGSQVVSVLASAEMDPTLATHTFSAVGEPGTAWYRIGAVQNAGLALEVALRWLGADVAEANAALGTGLQPDDPVFVPTLSGERTPFMNPALRGSWQQLSLSTDRQALLRSLLEGIAQGVALAVEAVRASGAPWPDVIPLVGGGTHDPGFRQLLADATGCALGVVEAPDAAVVGAAMLASGRLRVPDRVALTDIVEPDAIRAALLAQRRHDRLEMMPQ